jgi:HAMP domain-containing protein
MAKNYTWFHGAATAIACAAVGYQTAVIWETLTGVSTVTKLGVPLATISAAFLPVLAEAAWRGGERAKGFLLFLPVAVLLAFVLPSGVSRLGEAQQAKLETAELQQGERAKAEADLAKSKALVTEAQSWVAGQCSTGNGPKCKGVTFILEQRQAHQRELTAKVGTMTAPPTPWLPAWHPATLPIGLELAAWVSLFFGLGPLTHAKKQVAAVQAITEREEPLTDAEIAELVRVLLKNGGKGVNNNTLAELIGCSAGESSKRVADAVACGLVTKVRNGREVLIRPAEGVTVH